MTQIHVHPAPAEASACLKQGRRLAQVRRCPARFAAFSQLCCSHADACRSRLVQSVRVLHPDGTVGETLGEWLKPRTAAAEVWAHPARSPARAPRLLGLPARRAAYCSGWFTGPAAWCLTGLAVWVGASSLGPAARASLSPLCKSPRCDFTAAGVDTSLHGESETNANCRITTVRCF
jgi:hypothetical protein